MIELNENGAWFISKIRPSEPGSPFSKLDRTVRIGDVLPDWGAYMYCSSSRRISTVVTLGALGVTMYFRSLSAAISPPALMSNCLLHIEVDRKSLDRSIGLILPT